MSNYICLLLTSNGCGHCTAFRGDGIINNGKAYMNPDYIKLLFTQASRGHKINIFNIHYDDMSGQNKFISDISKFVYTKKGILQQRYFRFENKSRLRTILASSKNKELGVRDVLNKGNKVDWIDLVRDKIPDQIQNYTYYFPCFLMIETEEWNKALKDKDYPLAALTNAGFTISEDNVIKLDRNPATLNTRNVDIKEMIREVTDGTIKIEPHNKKELSPDNSLENSSDDSEFIIKNYDD